MGDTIIITDKPWNLRFLYVTLSTLNPMAACGEEAMHE